MAAKVLVVDDVAFNVKLLQAKLEQEYYEVLVAGSGLEAIEKARLEKPDIILMDAMMPDLNGFEATERIKNDPELSHIPVVIVTALNAQEDKIKGLQAGADDFLTKPINDKALSLRIKSLIRLKQTTDELRLRNESVKEFGEVTDQQRMNLKMDISGAKILMVDDDIVQLKKIRHFLQDKGLLLQDVSTPEEGMKLAQNEPFDLLVVSTILMEGDGLRFCSQFRSRNQFRNIPILILVDEADSMTLNKGLEIGITDYIVTPIELNEFYARCSSQIRRKKFQDSMKESISESVSASFIDQLTKLYNRRYFESHSTKLVQKAQEETQELALLMIDLDHFKSVNDTYGHPSGDAVLQDLSRRIKGSIRLSDLPARIGGEEFVIILPSTNLADAKVVAERVRAAVEMEAFTIPSEPGTIKCTCSIGVSMFRDGDNVATLLDRADKGLYKAKESGRNKVIIS